MCFTAAAIHFDLHIPSVIRYAGGNYTADYRNFDEIKKQLEGRVDPRDIADLRRVFTMGTPANLVAESSEENMLEYFRYGNHQSIQNGIEKVKKTMNKEDKHSYVIPMPNWLARFIPNSFYTPNGLLSKPGKNDRLVFDGSHMINWFSKPINNMVDMSTKSRQSRMVGCYRITSIEFGTYALPTQTKTFSYGMKISRAASDKRSITPT